MYVYLVACVNVCDVILFIECVHDLNILTELVGFVGGTIFSAGGVGVVASSPCADCLFLSC